MLTKNTFFIASAWLCVVEMLLPFWDLSNKLAGLESPWWLLIDYSLALFVGALILYVAEATQWLVRHPKKRDRFLTLGRDFFWLFCVGVVIIFAHANDFSGHLALALIGALYAVVATVALLVVEFAPRGAR